MKRTHSQIQEIIVLLKQTSRTKPIDMWTTIHLIHKQQPINPFQRRKVKLTHGIWTRDYLNLLSSLSPSFRVYKDSQAKDLLFTLQVTDPQVCNSFKISITYLHCKWDYTAVYASPEIRFFSKKFTKVKGKMTSHRVREYNCQFRDKETLFKTEK